MISIIFGTTDHKPKYLFVEFGKPSNKFHIRVALTGYFRVVTNHTTIKDGEMKQTWRTYASKEARKAEGGESFFKKDNYKSKLE